jgi:RNA polymerase sigma-70 factor (ECF subfamily)
MTTEPSFSQWTGELLRRIQRGDEEAESLLLSRFDRHLRAFLAARFLGSAVEDVAQEVWMRAFQSLPGFRYQGVGSFWAFLRTIALHCAIDNLRRQGRNKQVSADLERIEDPGKSPENQAILAERRERFERTLKRHPPRTQQAILMRLELKLSWKVIAEDLGIETPDAARMLVKRALEKTILDLREDD